MCVYYKTYIFFSIICTYLYVIEHAALPKNKQRAINI